VPDEQGSELLEQVYRAEYPRVLATLVHLTRDLDLAEDAVQEAFGEALRTWPNRGVPDRPGAWLTTTARNRALDVMRRERSRATREGAAAEEATDAPTSPGREPLGDDELAMVFLACHPAFAPESRLVVTLRFVFGLRVPEIARVLLQGEAGVAKRLQRARGKIRDARIPVELPPTRRLAERLPSALECLYLVFTEGYAATDHEDLIREDLCARSIRLTRLLVELAPEDVAARSLLALMLVQHSRAAARLRDGELVLLADQDRSRWDRPAITEALAHLDAAVAAEGLSATAASYRHQAAIAATHAVAPGWDETDWATILVHYDRLAELGASPVVALNRAVALSFVAGPVAALAELEPLATEPRLDEWHLFHSVRADLLRRLDDPAAADAYRRALELAATAPERRFLERRLAEVDPSTTGVREPRSSPHC